MHGRRKTWLTKHQDLSAKTNCELKKWNKNKGIWTEKQNLFALQKEKNLWTAYSEVVQLKSVQSFWECGMADI